MQHHKGTPEVTWSHLALYYSSQALSARETSHTHTRTITAFFSFCNADFDLKAHNLSNKK